MVSVLFATACNGSRTEPSPGAAPSGSAAAAMPTIEVVPVASKPLDTTTQLEGELTPYERVAIFARAKGFVSRVLVDRGTHVKQGQLLLTIVAPELGAQRAEAQAKLQGDKTTFDRLKAASQTPGGRPCGTVVGARDRVLEAFVEGKGFAGSRDAARERRGRHRSDALVDQTAVRPERVEAVVVERAAVRANLLGIVVAGLLHGMTQPLVGGSTANLLGGNAATSALVGRSRVNAATRLPKCVAKPPFNVARRGGELAPKARPFLSVFP